MFRQFSPAEFNHHRLDDPYWIQLLKLNKAVDEWDHDKNNKEKQIQVLQFFEHAVDNETERATLAKKERAAWAHLHSIVGASHDKSESIFNFIGDVGRYYAKSQVLQSVAIVFLPLTLTQSILLSVGGILASTIRSTEGPLKDWNTSNFLKLIRRLEEVGGRAEQSEYRSQYEQNIENLRISIKECEEILKIADSK